MTETKQLRSPLKYKTIFLSDVHLGTKNCQADKLLDFLKSHDADTYYLVGDIVDFWGLRKKLYWPESHNEVVQNLLRQVRKGAKIVYVLGNHDEALLEYCDHRFGDIEVCREAVYETSDGHKYLVMHGDQLDMFVFHKKTMAMLGDKAYEMSVILNRHCNRLRRKLGLPYWSFSNWIKQNMSQAFTYIRDYETVAAREMDKKQMDGVICGHIHHAKIETIDGIEYMNTGDWVESCTAIAETLDGQFKLLKWHEIELAQISDPVPCNEEPLSQAA